MLVFETTSVHFISTLKIPNACLQDKLIWILSKSCNLIVFYAYKLAVLNPIDLSPRLI